MKAIFILAFTALVHAALCAASLTFGANADFLHAATTCVLLYLIVGIVVGLQAEVDTDPSLSGMGLVLVALVWPLLILLSVMSTALLVMASACGYLLIGGIVAAVAARFSEDIDDDGALRGVVAAFWPLVLVAFIAVVVAKSVMSVSTRAGERLVSRGEDVLARDAAAEREAGVHGKLPRATARRK